MGEVIGLFNGEEKVLPLKEKRNMEKYEANSGT